MTRKTTFLIVLGALALALVASVALTATNCSSRCLSPGYRSYLDAVNAIKGIPANGKIISQNTFAFEKLTFSTPWNQVVWLESSTTLDGKPDLLIRFANGQMIAAMATNMRFDPPSSNNPNEPYCLDNPINGFATQSGHGMWCKNTRDSIWAIFEDKAGSYYQLYLTSMSTTSLESILNSIRSK